MTLGDFIKNYREDHGVSQRQFAEACGLSNGYIAILERGGANPSTGEPVRPTISSLKKIANGMGISMADLFARVDDMGVELRDSAEPFGLFGLPARRRVPRLGAIACGTPILAEQNIEDYDEVPDWVKCDFTLVCKGDSMTGARIHDGDIVCIKEQPEVESGQIAAVLVEGEFESDATLKRVRFQDGSIVLWPENPAYAPMVFSGRDVDRVRILGLATHFISRII